MITCIVLGTGIPTIPNYIITAAIAGPALLELGRAADRQPHVRLLLRHHGRPDAAGGAGRFAAAPIARESGLKIGCEAMKIAIAGFVVPFMAVYAPELMLQAGGAADRSVGFPLAVAYIVGKAMLAIGLWGGAIIGYLAGPLSWPMRLLAGAAALLLVLALPVTDEIGFALTASCSASSGGAAAAPPGVSLCILAGGAVTRARGHGLHPRLGAFGRARRLGRDLAGRARRPAPRRGPGPGLGRRDGARSRRPARGRMVGLAADGAAGPGARARRLGRHRRRLAAVPRRRLPPARRHARPADPAAALRAMMQG